MKTTETSLAEILTEMREALWRQSLDDEGNMVLPALVRGDVVQTYMKRLYSLSQNNPNDHPGGLH